MFDFTFNNFKVNLTGIYPTGYDPEPPSPILNNFTSELINLLYLLSFKLHVVFYFEINNSQFLSIKIWSFCVRFRKNYFISGSTHFLFVNLVLM